MPHASASPRGAPSTGGKERRQFDNAPTSRSHFGHDLVGPTRHVAPHMGKVSELVQVRTGPVKVSRHRQDHSRGRAGQGGRDVPRASPTRPGTVVPTGPRPPPGARSKPLPPAIGAHRLRAGARPADAVSGLRDAPWRWPRPYPRPVRHAPRPRPALRPGAPSPAHLPPSQRGMRCPPGQASPRSVVLIAYLAPTKANVNERRKDLVHHYYSYPLALGSQKH